MNKATLLNDYELQDRCVKAKGFDTRGYVSGYRGSPVGGIDLEISQNETLVADPSGSTSKAL